MIGDTAEVKYKRYTITLSHGDYAGSAVNIKDKNDDSFGIRQIFNPNEYEMMLELPQGKITTFSSYPVVVAHIPVDEDYRYMSVQFDHNNQITGSICRGTILSGGGGLGASFNIQPRVDNDGHQYVTWRDQIITIPLINFFQVRRLISTITPQNWDQVINETNTPLDQLNRIFIPIKRRSS